jgi:hypothetical protein
VSFTLLDLRRGRVRPPDLSTAALRELTVAGVTFERRLLAASILESRRTNVIAIILGAMSVILSLVALRR